VAGGAIIVVVVVAVVLVLLKVTGGKPSPSRIASSPSAGAGAATSSLAAQLTSIPAATLDQVGAGSASSHPDPITPAGTVRTVGGKPEMVYMGAEFCPYCAAERWAMITALSRFGTFTGLATIKSAAVDGAGNSEPYPATSTWTFAHATYTSTYLAFTPVEMYTNIPDSSTGNYTQLQKPTAAQQALISKYDAPPYVPSADQGAIPFVDYGGKYLSIGASYDPGVLQGLTWAQITADLHDPSSPVAKGVLGTANFMTAALCELTGNQPATACTPTVRSLQSHL
jgi:thiol-disulfide isomerase/thioredoxin